MNVIYYSKRKFFKLMYWVFIFSLRKDFKEKRKKYNANYTILSGYRKLNEIAEK